MNKQTEVCYILFQTISELKRRYISNFCQKGLIIALITIFPTQAASTRMWQINSDFLYRVAWNKDLNTKKKNVKFHDWVTSIITASFLFAAFKKNIPYNALLHTSKK
jgi:hypothetical protein